jgi:hypothetical protein
MALKERRKYTKEIPTGLCRNQFFGHPQKTHEETNCNIPDSKEGYDT